MATHSSVLVWKIPETGSLVGCRLWGRTESDTTEMTQQQQQQPLFSLVAVLVCIPTNSVRGFPVLHTLSSIYCLQTQFFKASVSITSEE